MLSFMPGVETKNNKNAEICKQEGREKEESEKEKETKSNDTVLNNCNLVNKFLAKIVMYCDKT